MFLLKLCKYDGDEVYSMLHAEGAGFDQGLLADLHLLV